ncbi:hypothetical protein PAXRUDRAFT_15897 [Paxillus rubicundulus Ve08.2h10]|uniref:Uncharacterized protein n=1 Tax=Paxillus rubicundulus Ve08.2h10 TaxID=930991 RepID=A0A0D0CBL7_9AGAM|nr:hypothetical protein PAXRUDRAFT_15897 [Paxillus rubicundulus Ve08.2h10]
MNCGTYDFSSFSHGNGPQSGSGRAANSSYGLSTNFLDVRQDTDLFGHPAPAFLVMNQQTGYSPTAYMHNIAALKERCNPLEMQLFKVAVECDILKAMLDQLAASLGSSTRPPLGSIKAAEMYPKMQFWTQTKYNEWMNTAKAHGDRWWKLAYLKDREGNTVSDDLLKGNCKKI